MMDKRLTQIAERIGCQNVLIQLAEECNELSQACLKLLRSQEGLTPVKEDVCIDNLAEELADVKICIEQIEYMYQMLQEKKDVSGHTKYNAGIQGRLRAKIRHRGGYTSGWIEVF